MNSFWKCLNAIAHLETYKAFVQIAIQYILIIESMKIMLQSRIIISNTAIPNDLVYVVLNASKQKFYLRTKKAFKGLFPKLALILVVCLMHTKQEEEEAYHTIF